jgi:hypothetical protein
MPLFMAVIGYVTKLLAIRMMFQPLDRRGWGPFSWQGVVPRHAARMAAISTELLTARLITPAEVVSRLDPEAMAEQLREPLASVVEQITREVMEEYSPGVWATLPREPAIGSCGGSKPRRRRSSPPSCAMSATASTGCWTSRPW